MTVELSLLASAFALGLAGAGHCLGMCGGIAAALNLGNARKLPVTLTYHLGRITSYTLLGATLGLAAGAIDVMAWTVSLRYIAGLLLIAMGLSIGGWWQGISILEKGGALLWKPVQAMSRRWLPVKHWRQSLALGLCWGLMPCGLIYSSLAFAATAQNALTSGAIMFVFGLGTLPAMLATSFGAQGVQSVLRNRGAKQIIAILLIASGLWTLYAVAMPHEHHHDHQESPPAHSNPKGALAPEDHSGHH
ncbi:MAG: sulfite exporter TauE/SafE family protein [Halioglobus sp.]